MAMDPSKLGFARQIESIPWNTFTGMISASYASAGNGGPVAVALGEHSGLLMDTDADEVSHLMKIPTYWNLHQPVRSRLVHSNLGTSGDVKFTIEYTGLTLETTVVAAPATAVVQTADVSAGTASILQATEWTTVTQSLLFNTTTNVAFDYLGCMIICTSQAAGDTTLYALEFEYAPRWGLGIGQDAQPWQAGVRGS